jgi:hypothetical protein
MACPALPDWAEVMIRVLEEHNRISPLDGIGCFPVMITASAEELLEWLEAGVRGGELPFPGEKWSDSLAASTLRRGSSTSNGRNRAGRIKQDSTHCRDKWSESSETWAQNHRKRGPNRVDERHVLAIRECVQVTQTSLPGTDLHRMGNLLGDLCSRVD